MTDEVVEQTQLESWEAVLLRAAHDMSLSPTQYQMIENRYGVLQDALNAATDPLLAEAHIFIQGSVRLKTTIKPAANAQNDMATIDADAVVWLPKAGAASATEVLQAIEKRFRESTRVEAPIELLRRGVRIVYADEDPGFHIDVTPARNAPGNTQTFGEGALVVPDRQTGWKASSPIPYSVWLEKAANVPIRLVRDDLTKRAETTFAEATQEPIPDYADYMRANPMRVAVKLLKRHRDEWAIRTKREAVRPISAVLTTLAGHAYASVAQMSWSRPLRTVEAVMEIVRRMPLFIDDQYGYAVLNPEDRGENFAEKWNRPNGEGAAYKQAFDDWHAAALQSIHLGLDDHGTDTAFREAVSKSFGISESAVDDVVRNLPGDWTRPGRAPGVTRNNLSYSKLTGAAATASATLGAVQPVGRLG